MNNDDLDYLIHFGYAPGWYMARCKSCQKTMDFVDKRAINCRPCAEELYQNRMKQNSTPSETATLNEQMPLLNPPIVMCHCGDRLPSECPGEWEPGCDLGNNEAHAVAVPLYVTEGRGNGLLNTFMCSDGKKRLQKD